ncbi:hypothetical protein BU15DRAFT_82009 [Melanogaster broomeanus]|nr:hypothetical protein BU15DRAFT_82009 [Melanogaster broomeanus]
MQHPKPPLQEAAGCTKLVHLWNTFAKSNYPWNSLPKVGGASIQLQTERIHGSLRAATSHIAALRYNELQPVVRLPQEMLLRIFDDATATANSTSLRNLSQVCHLWRDIILCAPLLWRKVLQFDLPRPWVEWMLLQTRWVPLDIHITHSEFTRGHWAQLTSNWILTAPHFWRFTTFDVEGPCNEINNFLIYADFEFKAPFLHKLSIRNSDLVFSEVYVSLPDDLVTLEPPLEDLVLVGCSFRWDLFSLGLLRSTHLSKLALRDLDESCIPNLFDLLTVLASLTALESLTLVNAFFREEDDNDTNNDVFTFSSLSVLTLHGSIDACAGFLTAIHTPVLISLDVETCVVGSSTVNSGIAQSFMDGVSQVIPMVECDSLEVYYRTRRLYFRSWGGTSQTLLSNVSMLWSPQGPLDHSMTGFMTSFMTSVSRMKPLQTVNHLMFMLSKNVHDEITTETWGEIFEPFRNVKKLDLGRYPPVLLLRALYRDAYIANAAQMANNPVELLMPALGSIDVPICHLYRTFVNIIGDLRGRVDKPLTRYTQTVEANDHGPLHGRILRWVEGSSRVMLWSDIWEGIGAVVET